MLSRLIHRPALAAQRRRRASFYHVFSAHRVYARGGPTPSMTRALHATAPLGARKDSQDKDSIDRRSYEYTRSGTDDQTAQQEQAAFDPSITDPQQQQAKAGEGEQGNPLDVSPANPDVSLPRKEDDEGGAGHAPGEQRMGSGSGAGKKNRSTT
ncbi:MAG: hypothetical protein M1826_002562 [Phylliscum demangeonii]|nr:MAG: hypothetical protein M1826_002562 [Phylliscum demangeonii]